MSEPESRDGPAGSTARTLLPDPDLLAALGEHATPDTEFDFTDVYDDGRVVRGVEGVTQ